MGKAAAVNLRRQDQHFHAAVLGLAGGRVVVGDRVLVGVAHSQRSADERRKADQLFPRPSDDSLLEEIFKVLCDPGEQARVLVVEDDLDLGQIVGESLSPA